jgi:DNA-binding transcriptional ArsR family regulator
MSVAATTATATAVVGRFPVAPAPRTEDVSGGGVTDGDVAGDDLDLATLVSLLEDEHVRSILVATSTEALSATELGERCELSPSSIYRRVDDLLEAGLLAERTRPRSDGHHESVYVARLDRLAIELDEGELSWTLERCETDPADELTRLWGRF